MATYTIIIQKHERVTYPYKDWVKVADSGNERDGKAQYDYALTERTESQETIMYQQDISINVFEDTLPRVVAAVNGLDKEED